MWLDQQALLLLRPAAEGPNEAPPLARALASTALGLALFLEIARASLDAAPPASLIPFARKALLRFRRSAAELKVARRHHTAASALSALRPRLQEWVRALRAHARALSHCLLAERLWERGDEEEALCVLARAARAARAAADGASACSRQQPALPPLRVLGMRVGAPDRGRSARRVRTGQSPVGARPATAGAAASPASRWVVEAESGVETLRGAVRAAVQRARDGAEGAEHAGSPDAFLASHADVDPDFAILYGPEAALAAGEGGGDEDAVVGAGVSPEGLVSLCGPEGDPRFAVGPTGTTWSTASADDLGYGWSLLLYAAWEQELAHLLTVTAAAAAAEAAVRLGLVARRAAPSGDSGGSEGEDPAAAGDGRLRDAATRLSSVLLGAAHRWGLEAALPHATTLAARVLRHGARGAAEGEDSSTDPAGSDRMAPLTGAWPAAEPSLVSLCSAVERAVAASSEPGEGLASHPLLLLYPQRASDALSLLLRGRAHAPGLSPAPQSPSDSSPDADGQGAPLSAGQEDQSPSADSTGGAPDEATGAGAAGDATVEGTVLTASVRGPGDALLATLRHDRTRPVSAAPPSRRRATSAVRPKTQGRDRVRSARIVLVPAARAARCALCEVPWRRDALVRAVPMGLVERMRQWLGVQPRRVYSPPALAHTSGRLCSFCAQFFDPSLPESAQRPFRDPAPRLPAEEGEESASGTGSASTRRQHVPAARQTPTSTGPSSQALLPTRLRTRPSTASPRPADHSPQRGPVPRERAGAAALRRGSTGRVAEAAARPATAATWASDGAGSVAESLVSGGDDTARAGSGDTPARGEPRRSGGTPSPSPVPKTICRGLQRLPAGHDAPLLATGLIRHRNRTAVTQVSSPHQSVQSAGSPTTTGLGRVPWKRPQPSVSLPRSPGAPHRVPLAAGFPASYLSQGSACAMARVAHPAGDADQVRGAAQTAPNSSIAARFRMPGPDLPLPRGDSPRSRAVSGVLHRAAQGYSQSMLRTQRDAEILSDAFATLPAERDATVLGRLFHRLLTSRGAGAWRSVAAAFAAPPGPPEAAADEWTVPLGQNEAAAMVHSLAPEPGNAVPTAAVAAALIEPALGLARSRRSDSAVLAALQAAAASTSVAMTRGAVTRLDVARLMSDAGTGHCFCALLLGGPSRLSWPALATLAALTAAPSSPSAPAPPQQSDAEQPLVSSLLPPSGSVADSGAQSVEEKGSDGDASDAMYTAAAAAAEVKARVARLRTAWRQFRESERGSPGLCGPASMPSLRRGASPDSSARLRGSVEPSPVSTARAGSDAGSTTLRRICSAQRTARAARDVNVAAASAAATACDMQARGVDKQRAATASRTRPRQRPATRQSGGTPGRTAHLRRRVSASAAKALSRTPVQSSGGRKGAGNPMPRSGEARPQTAVKASHITREAEQARTSAQRGQRSAAASGRESPSRAEGGEAGGSDPWPLSSSSRLARGKLRLSTQRCGLCEYPFHPHALPGQTLLSAVMRLRAQWGYPCEAPIPAWASCSTLPLCAMCTAIRDGALSREEARHRAARAQEASRRRTLKARLAERRKRMLDALDRDRSGPTNVTTAVSAADASQPLSAIQGWLQREDDSAEPWDDPSPSPGPGALTLPQPEQERVAWGEDERFPASTTEEAVAPEEQATRPSPHEEPVPRHRERPSPPQAPLWIEEEEPDAQGSTEPAQAVRVPQLAPAAEGSEPVNEDLRHELEAFQVSLLKKQDRLMQRRCAADTVPARRVRTHHRCLYRAALQRKKAQLIRARIERTQAPPVDGRGST